MSEVINHGHIFRKWCIEFNNSVFLEFISQLKVCKSFICKLLGCFVAYVKRILTGKVLKNETGSAKWNRWLFILYMLTVCKQSSRCQWNSKRINEELHMNSKKPSGFSGGNLDFCFPAAKGSLLFSQCTPLALHRNLTRK